jgi:cytochrome c-type biogenesis protein CcmH/NrfF
MRRLVAALTALALLTALAGLSRGPLASAAVPRTTLPAVEAQVMCVTCKIPLLVAQSHQANRERAYIRGLIQEGRTLDQIKHDLVEQYGSVVLALPADHGFDLAAYLVPAAVVLALLLTVAILLPRWRAHARDAQAARAREGATRGALDPADAARLEADMARFER